MLVICNSIQTLNWEAVCQIYEEGFQLRGRKAYPYLPENAQILQAQQDTYQYLRDEFYVNADSYYAFWVDADRWVSALRMRPYQDGLLLDALETAPEFRRQGFAGQLMQAVLARLPQHTKVYSRIMRRNKASVRLHLQCGFHKHRPYAVFLDGSFRPDADTYLYQKET